ncbi:RNA polymerase sigma factor [Parapedobacter deserti]|uniref:RNA polymerase sigma factor n=1 Tax=Parapedobacter deserti TaxID=1912957 RepID=A0ABV7JTM2_9SPHI
MADLVVLAENIRDDNPKAFDRLVDTYWEDLYRQAYVRLRDQAEAEDLVQDLFAELWERRNTVTITTSWSAYLRSALKYKVIKRAALRQLHQSSMEHLVLHMEQFEDKILDLLSAGEVHQTLDAAVARLPENMRKIFLMRASHLTVAQVAEALGLSEQTVKNNNSEALRRLRRVIAEQHPHIPPSFYAALTLFILN